MELIALLSGEKETWGQISGLIKHGEWEKIIIIGNENAKNFNTEKPTEFVQIDLSMRLKDLRDDLLKKLKGKIEGMEVGLSIATGNGKEHMALISSLINLPVGIRFAALTKEGVIDF